MHQHDNRLQCGCMHADYPERQIDLVTKKLSAQSMLLCMYMYFILSVMCARISNTCSCSISLLWHFSIEFALSICGWKGDNLKHDTHTHTKSTLNKRHSISNECLDSFFISLSFYFCSILLFLNVAHFFFSFFFSFFSLFQLMLVQCATWNVRAHYFGFHYEY